MLAVLVVSFAACTGTPAPTIPTSTATASTNAATRAPTPTTDPAAAAAEAAVLEAYRGFWAAKIAAFADPSKDPGPELSHFAVDDALAETGSTILTLRQSGIAFTGEPVLTPAVSDVVTGQGGTATITDCVNSANWQPVFVPNGEPAAAPDQPAKLLTTSVAYYYENRWTIRSSVIDRDAPC